MRSEGRASGAYCHPYRTRVARGAASATAGQARDGEPGARRETAKKRREAASAAGWWAGGRPARWPRCKDCKGLCLDLGDEAGRSPGGRLAGALLLLGWAL